MASEHGNTTCGFYLPDSGKRERTVSVEVRRRAAEKVFERAARSGRSIDQDPRFHGWIDEWIAGNIEMSEVARRYSTLLGERAETRKAQATSASVGTDQQGLDPSMDIFDLETEISRSMAEDAS